MTDIEWIAAVRDYALRFGAYNFSQEERQRMLPYVRGHFLKLLHNHRYMTHMSCNLVMTFDLLDEMERGMAMAIAAKLTQ